MRKTFCALTVFLALLVAAGASIWACIFVQMPGTVWWGWGELFNLHGPIPLGMWILSNVIVPASCIAFFVAFSMEVLWPLASYICAMLRGER